MATPEGEREVWTPTTQPLGSIDMNDGLAVLADADVERLLPALAREASRRNLLSVGGHQPVDPFQTAASLLQAGQTRDLEPGETCTIGTALETL